MSNGQQTKVDIAHRIGIWVSVVGLAAYLFNIGSWVGAADEKFNDAETVEEKQEQLILDVNTLAVEQKYTKEAVEANKEAIEESRKEILAAIKEAQKDDN